MNPALPFLLLGAHLIGDFVLQDDWMAKGKASSWWVCWVHGGAYATPFLLLVVFCGLPSWAYLAIWAQHVLQDRYALHLKWMKLWGQTTADKWPTGPLCVDQAMHVGFIALVVAFI